MALFKRRKLDKEQLDRLDELESILEAINRSRAAIEFDTNGNILKANENFLKVMGYTAEEIQGRHHSMFVHPEFAKSEEYNEFWRSLRDGKYISAKFPRVAKNGSEVIIQAAYNPVIRDEETRKIIKFATDITDIENERSRNLAERASQEQLQNTVVSALRESLERLANGDLRAEIRQEFDGRYSQIRDDFNRALR
ncbi:MAG: PAS domain S-box protein, partial [Caulobacteraceae bacterium]